MAKGRRDIMLARKVTDSLVAKMGREFIVQPKIEGVRCRAVFHKTGVTLFSSQGNEFVTVPHIVNDLLELDRGHIQELDGELYVHGWPFQDIISVVKRKVMHPDFFRIEYHIFDYVSHEPQIDRLTYLQKKLKPTGALKRVDSTTCTLAELQSYYEIFLNQGYEGIVLRAPFAPYERKRTSNLLKLKPKKRGWFPIIGYAEEISIHGEPKGTLGALICEADGESFRVGSGPLFTKNSRVILWEVRDELIGKTARVKYQGLTLRGVPYFPVGTAIAGWEGRCV